MRQLREDCAAKVTKIQQKGKLQYMIKLLALQRDRKERKVMGIICDIGLKERPFQQQETAWNKDIVYIIYV